MEGKDGNVTKEEKSVNKNVEKDNKQEKCDYCGVTEQRLYRLVYMIN